MPGVYAFLIVLFYVSTTINVIFNGFSIITRKICKNPYEIFFDQ